MSNYNYVEILNPTTGHAKIVDEHSDQEFFEGYTKLVRYVPNHEIDIFEQDALREEKHLIEMANSPTDNMSDAHPNYGSEGANASDSYYNRAPSVY